MVGQVSQGPKKLIVKRHGQITLETAVLILLALNMFLYITMPVGSVSRAAAESVGTSALAAKAVNAIVNKANLVGISGEGARDEMTFEVMRDFEDMDCSSTGCSGSDCNVSIDFHYIEYTAVGNPSNSFGVRADLLPPTSTTYSRLSDFELDCNITLDPNDIQYTACACFNNSGDEVQIMIFKRLGAECGCAGLMGGGWTGGTPSGPVCGEAGFDYSAAHLQCNYRLDKGLCSDLSDCNSSCLCNSAPPPPGSYCGNGVKDGSEDCDIDGDDDRAPVGVEGSCGIGEVCEMSGITVGVDKCACVLQVVSGTCGNHLIDGSEMCDLYNDTIAEGAPFDCATPCVAPGLPNNCTCGLSGPAVCGDGLIVVPTESCDPGGLGTSPATPNLGSCTGAGKTCGPIGSEYECKCVCPCADCDECTTDLADTACQVINITADIDCGGASPPAGCPT